MQKTKLQFLKQILFYFHLANLILAWNSTKSAHLNVHIQNCNFWFIPGFLMHGYICLTDCLTCPIKEQWADTSTICMTSYSHPSTQLPLWSVYANTALIKQQLLKELLTCQLQTKFPNICYTSDCHFWLSHLTHFWLSHLTVISDCQLWLSFLFLGI